MSLRCDMCEEEAEYKFAGFCLCSIHYASLKNQKYTCPFCEREFPMYDEYGNLTLEVIRGYCDDCD